MTFEFYVITLLACAAATAYVTQKAKGFLDKKKVKYASNTLAAVIGFVIGIIVAAVEVAAGSFEITPETIFFILAVGIGSIAGAMFGYDKVVQWLRQIRAIQSEAEKLINGDTETSASIDTIIKQATDTASDIVETTTSTGTEGAQRKNE